MAKLTSALPKPRKRTFLEMASRSSQIGENPEREHGLSSVSTYDMQLGEEPEKVLDSITHVEYKRLDITYTEYLLGN